MRERERESRKRKGRSDIAMIKNRIHYENK
jgi:hypothetical protein